MKKHVQLDLVWSENNPEWVEVHYNGAHKYNLALNQGSTVTFNIGFGKKSETRITITTAEQNSVIVPPITREIQL